MNKFLIGLGLVGGLVAAAILLSQPREESLADRLQNLKVEAPTHSNRIQTSTS